MIEYISRFLRTSRLSKNGFLIAHFFSQVFSAIHKFPPSFGIFSSCRDEYSHTRTSNSNYVCQFFSFLIYSLDISPIHRLDVSSYEIIVHQIHYLLTLRIIVLTYSRNPSFTSTVYADSSNSHCKTTFSFFATSSCRCCEPVY